MFKPSQLTTEPKSIKVFRLIHQRQRNNPHSLTVYFHWSGFGQIWSIGKHVSLEVLKKQKAKNGLEYKIWPIKKKGIIIKEQDVVRHSES